MTEDDDDQGGDELVEREPGPVFGCAHEDPLLITTICPACIEYLAEQDRAAREGA